MHDSAVVERSWLGGSRNIRPAVIYGCELGAIGARSLFVLSLHTGRLDVLFTGSLSFLGRSLARARRRCRRYS